ncbi:phage tail protein [Escherichia coli]
MFHVDNNSGVANMPALAPAQSNTTTWFTEGDGQKGISWIGQDWLNILQAELLNILAEASIQPDKAQLNQLTLSIKAIIAANAFSRKNNVIDKSAFIRNVCAVLLPAQVTVITFAFAVNIQIITGGSRILQVGKVLILRQSINVTGTKTVFCGKRPKTKITTGKTLGFRTGISNFFQVGLRETVNKAADALPSGGTAVAANRLATPRNINGVPFDGTLDINITSGMTQSTADGRYVQNVQLGAQSYHSPGGNEMSWNYSAPSGCMLSGINVQETGSRSADNIGGVYYRPVQIYINNAWRTVSSV